MLNSTHDALATAKPIRLGSTFKSVQGTLDPGDHNTHFVAFRTQNRSRLYAEVNGDGNNNDSIHLSLVRDANQNGYISNKEVLAHSRSVSSATGDELVQALATQPLPKDTYFLQVTGTGTYTLSAALADSNTLLDRGSGRVADTTATLDRGSGRVSDIGAFLDRGSGRVSRRVSVSSNGKRIGKKDWGASFLNLSSNTVDDHNSYDFSQADAVHNLGNRNKRGKTAAQLQFDFSYTSPDGVNSDNFAMEAQTRITLKKGSFYRITSTSDDGIRFSFKDKKTQNTITEIDGAWGDRSLRDPAYRQILADADGGAYDFAVQYYERTGISAANVKLEQVELEGQVVSSGLNLRSDASTVGTTTLDVLTQGEQFKILRYVESPNDSTYRNWYQIVTSDQQKGYVAADASFVDLIGESDTVISIGGNTVVPPTLPPDVGGGSDPLPLPGSGSADPAQGYISSKVWITSDDKISLRSDDDISGLELGRLSAGTPVTILGEAAGGRYLNSFDLWYNVSVNLNGKTQQGYVAAYYVERATTDGTFGTAISKNNSAYAGHLDEATYARLDPKNSSYKPLIESAASRYSWLTPSVVAGIGSRESAWGRILSPVGPGGTGDGGHGRGLMQIDDRYHQTFINSGLWSDAKSNIDYAIDNVLSKNYTYLDTHTNLEGQDLLRGAIAAYNAGLSSVTKALAQGLDIDYYTTGQDYSWDVLNRAGWFQSNGWT